MESEKEGEKELVKAGQQGNVPEDEDPDEVEEAAEVLMTDMTLDDDMDKIRDPEAGSMWIYHIEAYPWHADDVNEHFIRLMKLASFTKLSVRKKPVSHESGDLERIDDKVMERQRKGSLHLYAESYQTAKSIMRHSIWKNMMSKELTFEITKRCLNSHTSMTARVDVDTVSMCKVKFRDKTKGNFNARTAKISNLPREVTPDILDIVFCRSYVAYTGSQTETTKETKENNLQQPLGAIPNFNGSLDVDCLNRGSCRALVLALKSVNIMGNDLSIVANDSQTMVVPQETQSVGLKNKEETKTKTSATGLTGFRVQVTSGRGREVRDNTFGHTGSLTRINSPVPHTVQSARIHPLTSIGRSRGMGVGRGMMTSQQSASASFARAVPGMPVPMTGRQKMNEKIRRNHPNIVAGTPMMGMHPPMGASAGFRAANMKSVGDSFKQEIASLQSELERSTQAIEAKIERLKEESSYYGYNEEMNMVNVDGEWDEDAEYEYDISQDDYFDEGRGDYFAQSYDMLSHDTFGYELSYEQPVEPMMPVSHGVSRRRTGRARGIVHVGGQRAAGFMDGITSVRNPQQIRNVRGRGVGGVFQGPGSSSGYW